ncbi:MAG: hypothetical protein R3E87_21665 [Burkholderiaceae bacterium]
MSGRPATLAAPVVKNRRMLVVRAHASASGESTTIGAVSTPGDRASTCATKWLTLRWARIWRCPLKARTFFIGTVSLIVVAAIALVGLAVVHKYGMGPFESVLDGPRPKTQGAFIDFETFRDDVAPQDLKPSEKMPAFVPEGFDWFGGWRAGNADLPKGFSAQVGWFETFAVRDHPMPAGHNTGIRVLRLIEAQVDNGKLRVLRDTFKGSRLDGFEFLSYSPQATTALQRRDADRLLEYRQPESGRPVHVFPQKQLETRQASAHLVAVQLGKIRWDPTGPDDRDEVPVLAHVGIDWWRFKGAPFRDGGVNNRDGGISRSRLVGPIESPSWHVLSTLPYADEAGQREAHRLLAEYLGGG